MEDAEDSGCEKAALARRVLIVEDDAVTRTMLAVMLRGRGYAVSESADAEGAERLWAQQRFGLAMIDYRLPGTDGLELCRRLRATPQGERCVVLVITAAEGPESLNAALEAGADDFLRKPLDPALLGVRLTIAERQLDNLKERLRLEREILEISSEQQERIGQDLHDSLGQSLTGIAYLVWALGERLAAGGLAEEAAEAIRVQGLVNEALARTQHLARGLFPVELDAHGLGGALRDLAATTASVFGVDCRFDGDESVALADRRTAGQLYRIAQEAVNNAVKHSGAGRITIELHALRPERVQLAVRDNGRGPGPGRKGGLGLNIMRYRARLLGAALDVGAAPGGGMQVVCELEVPAGS